MAKENVKAFMELVEKDSELQKKIQEADTAFAKNNKDVDENEALATILLPIAKEAGFEFTVEEFKDEMSEEGSLLSVDELDQVAGGSILCTLIGYSKEADAFIGKQENGPIGFGACWYIGIGATV